MLSMRFVGAYCQNLIDAMSFNLFMNMDSIGSKNIGVIIGLALFSNLQAVPLSASVQLNKVAKQLVSDGMYSVQELESLIRPLTIDKKILELMDRQAEGKPWYKYRDIFVRLDRIKAGVEFMQLNAKTLTKAQDQYGVPPHIIAALIGVETFYGTRMGSRSVLRSLVTLTAAYPKRAKFFGKELRKFLTIVKSEQLVPYNVEGSYAGAIGIPQFMPSSYEVYAVDFNGNGKRDLVNEVDDAIGSIANYLNVHGWQRGKPTRDWLNQSVSNAMLSILKKKAKPQNTITELTALGLKLNYHGETKANLMRLKQQQRWKYFVSFKNFHTLTRYNPSNKYAMAIVDLSDEILAAAN